MKRTFVEVFSKKKYPNNPDTFYDVDVSEETVKVIHSSALNNKSNWTKPDQVSLELNSTGNEFVIKNSFEPDKVIKLDYCEAAELYLALQEYYKVQKYGQFKLFRKKKRKVKNGRS